MTPPSFVPAWRLMLTRAFRVSWILLWLLAVLWLAQRGEHFYYQGF